MKSVVQVGEERIEVELDGDVARVGDGERRTELPDIDGTPVR